MTECEYILRRRLLQKRFLAIPNPKVLRRMANRVLRMIAALDAEYLGQPEEDCYNQLVKVLKEKGKL